MKAVVLLILGFATAINGLFFNYPAWDGLRVTWSLNPLDKYAFDKMPRDNVTAVDQNWVFRDNQCDDPNNPFVGQRYWLLDGSGNGDPELTLIYDINGIIAGIQTSVPSDPALFQYPLGKAGPYYVKEVDGTRYSLTVYFVDPKTICTTGRTQDDLNTSGTGDGFYVQNGATPTTSYYKAPGDTTSAAADQSLFPGTCINTIGLQYWSNFNHDTGCYDDIPFGFVYNDKKLTGFTFVMNIDATGPRYEYLTVDQWKAYYPGQNVPGCFYTVPSYRVQTLMHVYLKDNVFLTSYC